MALDKPGLTADLQIIAEEAPSTYAEAGTLWGAAMEQYAAAIVPPSTTVGSASDSLAAALASAFATQVLAAPAIEAAFAAFAATLASGMVAPGVVPPPGLIGFATLLVPPYPETHADGASAIANAIDLWMRTGTYTSGGSPTPWS